MYNYYNIEFLHVYRHCLRIFANTTHNRLKRLDLLTDVTERMDLLIDVTQQTDLLIDITELMLQRLEYWMLIGQCLDRK